MDIDIATTLQIFILEYADNKITYSPIKLLVPGIPILPRTNKKKNTENSGIH